MNTIMTEEELDQFIQNIEETDLVAAPPGICETVIQKIEEEKKITEYYRFRNRVIAAVASILILLSVFPVLEETAGKIGLPSFTLAEQTEKEEMNTLSDLLYGHEISDLLNGKE